MQDNKNIILATLFSAIILLGWTWFYEKPKAEKKAEAQKILIAQQNSNKTVESQPQPVQGEAENTSTENNLQPNKTEEAILTVKNRSEILSETK